MSPSDQPQHSGSRWEPETNEQSTEVLTPPPAAPLEPKADVPARRGLSTTVAVLIAVLLGGLGGAVAGFAVAGDRDEQPASSVVSDQQVPGENGGFDGHRGFGSEHEGERR